MLRSIKSWFSSLLKMIVPSSKSVKVVIIVKDGYVESVISLHKLDVKVIDMDYILKPSDNETIDGFYKEPNYNFYPQLKRNNVC